MNLRTHTHQLIPSHPKLSVNHTQCTDLPHRPHSFPNHDYPQLPRYAPRTYAGLTSSNHPRVFHQSMPIQHNTTPKTHHSTRTSPLSTLNTSHYECPNPSLLALLLTCRIYWATRLFFPCSDAASLGANMLEWQMRDGMTWYDG